MQATGTEQDDNQKLCFTMMFVCQSAKAADTLFVCQSAEPADRGGASVGFGKAALQGTPLCSHTSR